MTKETVRKYHNKCHRACGIRMPWRSGRVSGL
jgi:hypothetical protein